MWRKCYFAGIISRGSYRSSYASAQLFRGRRSTFEASNWKSLKRILILRSSVWSTCHFWRKSRTESSFLIFFIFEGSLVQMVRFWSSKLHFLKEVSQKCFVFELQSVFLEEVSQKSFVWQNHLNHTSVDNQITWTSNHLTSKSLESQINWQPTHLNLKSIDNQITWISDQLTTESLESQINWQPHHLKVKSTDNQNHLTFNSFESDINWFSTQLNSAQPLPIGSLSLETSATALCGRYLSCYIHSWLCGRFLEKQRSREAKTSEGKERKENKLQKHEEHFSIKNYQSEKQQTKNTIKRKITQTLYKNL